MELYGSGAASSRFYKMIPFCFRVEHQNAVCRWICGAADLRHLTCQLLLLRNVLEEIPRFCRVWWESSGYCSCGSFCFFFDVVRCRALRLLELLQSLFYGRGIVCGFLFSRKAMKDRSCCIRWFDVLFVYVCVSLVVCVFLYVRVDCVLCFFLARRAWIASRFAFVQSCFLWVWVVNHWFGRGILAVFVGSSRKFVPAYVRH